MSEFDKDINVPSRKGVFIPDITVEMFRNASLEGVEDLLASGEMEDISLPTAERWIPVTERLPEEYTRVIGYMAWKAMTAIEYQHGKWYSIDHLEPLPDEAVSHWMPLPKPPKEGER